MRWDGETLLRLGGTLVDLAQFRDSGSLLSITPSSLNPRAHSTPIRLSKVTRLAQGKVAWGTLGNPGPNGPWYAYYSYFFLCATYFKAQELVFFPI